MECDHCNHIFKSHSSLKHHQKTAIYCLKIQGVKNTKFICTECKKVFASNNSLSVHKVTCRTSKSSLKLREQLSKAELQITQCTFLIEQKDTQLKNLEHQIKELQDKLENVAIKACLAQNLAEDLSTIEIENDDNIDTDENDYYFTPLEVGSGYIIEHRDEDGYINVTNLCKAGEKQFKHWKSIEKTKAFLHVLSSEVGIPTSELIKLGTGSVHKTSQTWVHPQVAINIAQWISPRFDVKVSGWVYEVMMTGKVDITNTKSYKQLQLENKDHKIKIKYLTKKYVKRQPRLEYTEKNVIYILTTPNMKKDRRYIMGKAENLTNRLSVYNKSDEHEVIYYQGCGEIEDMNLVEPMVFKKLNEYREQANRERFVLNEDMEISYFINIIKECIKFFEH
jgi:hypothetical protein